MKPIDETVEAIAELDATDADLLDRLQQMSEQVRASAPDCVGLSIASLEHGVTFTLVATTEEIAALDGIQYLDGGPCVESVKSERVIRTTSETLLDEEAWHFIAHATAAASVASTLTLPILHGGRVVGSVNLYGGSRDSFTGLHEELAEIFSAWAPGAVANADLGFTTRSQAELAPGKLKDQARVETAVGLIAGSQQASLDTARARLADAAQRAGVTEVQLARLVIEAASMRDPE